MSVDEQLVRLASFEGLCLTHEDLATDQMYHRRALRRHARYVSGSGVVQGLSVELTRVEDRYQLVLRAGFGLTHEGQGIHLAEDLETHLDIPRQEGQYVLWLRHRDVEHPDGQRPVFDTADTRSSRTVEQTELALLPVGDAEPMSIALARIDVRLGRMALLKLPVPRAGRPPRASESYLKPRVDDFVRLQRRAMDRLFRTALLQELSLAAYGLYSALVSAEFLMIEEGTSDRVLYRTAGSLVRYAAAFYGPLPATTERIGRHAEQLRELAAGVPDSTQTDDVWLAWFETFQNVLPGLRRAVEELEDTAEARS